MTKIHLGDYTHSELSAMSMDQLFAIIMGLQGDNNFILQSDSYKMTHHLLYPKYLQEVYSYMESRGGEMPYTVFYGLQYYMMRYLAGVRITKEKIEEARAKNVLHFGFDCFDDTMWYHILENHGGRLPLEIKAVPEGTPVKVKNILMSIRNTDPNCAALTNITETLLMKLWAPNTVAAYARIIFTLISYYSAMTSDVPDFMIPYMHHDFGYRGVSSEESARILGSAGLAIGFVGTDTLGAIKLAETYYDEPMAGYSVIASEHSVMCSYGGSDHELEAYKSIIEKVKKDCANVNPASGVIILSLVSDTYNIYRVCSEILPALAHTFIGWKNENGATIKIVLRPDSGEGDRVLFGYNRFEDFDEFGNATVKRYCELFNVPRDFAAQDIRKGVFNILFEKFGCVTNSKGYKTLPSYIGVLQGDGVSMETIKNYYDIMVDKKIDTMSLVFGSGGKYLQAHDRDEQKFAIKATHVIVDGKGIVIEKNPVTDAGKKSKHGYLKLVNDGRNWTTMRTLQSGDPGFDEANDILQTVFYNGEILKKFTFAEVRNNAKLQPGELN